MQVRYLLTMSDGRSGDVPRAEEIDSQSEEVPQVKERAGGGIKVRGGGGGRV